MHFVGGFSILGLIGFCILLAFIKSWKTNNEGDTAFDVGCFFKEVFWIIFIALIFIIVVIGGAFILAAGMYR